MKKIIWICLGIAVLLLTCFFVNLFVIGEPVDGNQLAYTTEVTDNSMKLRLSAVEPAVALRSWTIQRDGADLSIQARKVLVSPLFPSGTYETTLDIEGITRVYLGGQLIFGRDA